MSWAKTSDEKGVASGKGGVACGKGGVTDGKQNGNNDKLDHTNVLLHCTAAGYLWLIEKGHGNYKDLPMPEFWHTGGRGVYIVDVVYKSMAAMIQAR